MSQVLVVADDLTGGNATSALFARRGLRTISVGPDPAHWNAAADADVVVVNTDSRRTGAADLVARVVDAPGGAARRPVLGPIPDARVLT